MTTVFMTGGTGCLGRVIVRELLSRGLSVSNLTRSDQNIAGVWRVPGSLQDLGDAFKAVSESDAVIHFACTRSNLRELVIDADITGMAKLLDAWRRGPFIYASSQTVYGIPTGDLTEASPLRPSCWYDFGKVSNEYQLVMATEGEPARRGISLRMAVVFGPRRSRGAPQFLDMIYPALLRGDHFIFDSEEGLRTYGTSFIGDSDLARATIDSMPSLPSGAYNVSGGYCTWGELLNAFGSVSGKRPHLRVKSGAVPDAGEYRLPQSRSFLHREKFDAATGFVARQSLEQLVDAFVRSYQANG